MLSLHLSITFAGLANTLRSIDRKSIRDICLYRKAFNVFTYKCPPQLPATISVAVFTLSLLDPHIPFCNSTPFTLVRTSG